jgi:uncharacterized protein YbgA (DUF1722 family)/uncharacterized protein YbbK (DUF523 family)
MSSGARPSGGPKVKIKIGISSCLLGERVRYDAGHKLDPYITETLGQYFRWVPVCPEVGAGLTVPREAMRLVGEPASPRIVTRKTGIDHTGLISKWSERKARELEREDLCGFIFKSRSPSSGLSGVKVYTEEGMPSSKGTGIFAAVFMRRFPHLPAIDEGRLHDPALRENFIEKVFAYRRWRELASQRKSVGALVKFHTAHKLLVMAHSPRHYREMGALVAGGKKHGITELYEKYLTLFMEAMGLMSTVKKNTNVLQHMMGYFKKDLSPDEKRELAEIIGSYHRGLVPLIVPITMMKHYVRKFGETYLKGQYYLNPHPQELMLRNHA